ncbi:hypothetical protein RHSP_37575 [Rhizobium freirei PRF 81]|uniref:Uncharacterized protein n=1 Tax=Rhizobium freirei PRF 81 TaxID=363754 RepID=N6V4N6_9HYPH|nr:hypothetical protein RHSP_37575 [Rhizobium freirei PRF 81]
MQKPAPVRRELFENWPCLTTCAERAERHMAIDVFVKQVAERAWAASVACLRAESAQPHEVAGFHLDPILVQAIDGLALQHVEAVLHDMSFGKGNDGARLQGDDRHMHVVTQIGRIDETGRRPTPFGAGHGCGRDIFLVEDQRLRMIQSFNGLIGLADPVEPGMAAGAVVERPFQAWRQKGIAARLENVLAGRQRQLDLAIDDEEHAFGFRILFRPIAAAARRHFHDILRKGLGKAGERAGDYPAARIVPEGQKAGDDILHDPFGNDRIGFGEDGSPRQEIALRRMAAKRGIIDFLHRLALRSQYFPGGASIYLHRTIGWP